MQENRIENQINQSFVTLATVNQSVVRPFRSVALEYLIGIALVSLFIVQNKKIVSDASSKETSLTSQNFGRRFGDYNV